MMYEIHILLGISTAIHSKFNIAILVLFLIVVWIVCQGKLQRVQPANHILHRLYPQCITLAEATSVPFHLSWRAVIFCSWWFSFLYLFPTNYSSHYLFYSLPSGNFISFFQFFHSLLVRIFKAELLRGGSQAWLMDRGENWVIKSKRFFFKRTGGIFRSRYLMDLCQSLLPPSLALKTLISSLVSYDSQAGVIEAGVFQIALIRPSANVINQKYKMIWEKYSFRRTKSASLNSYVQSSNDQTQG